ncbi:MAG TPA: hypothetical protein VGB19_05300 [Actinomycetota bacterium]
MAPVIFASTGRLPGWSRWWWVTRMRWTSFASRPISWMAPAMRSAFFGIPQSTSTSPSSDSSTYEFT